MNTRLEGSELLPRQIPVHSKGGESSITLPGKVVVVNQGSAEGWVILRPKASKQAFPGEYPLSEFKPA